MPLDVNISQVRSLSALNSYFGKILNNYSIVRLYEKMGVTVLMTSGSGGCAAVDAAIPQFSAEEEDE